MAIHHLTLDDLRAAAGPRAPGSDDVVVVDLDAGAGPPPPATSDGPILIGLTRTDPASAPAADRCDVVLPHGSTEADAALATVAATPRAARALVTLMRADHGGSLDAALEAESAVYSALQGGPEFAAWRASHPVRARPDDEAPVALRRDGASLEVVLDRPDVRNALNTAMRDALVEAFALPALDPSITQVHLRGAGESFCAGGDLDEFGSFPDPATAHVLRLRQSVGRAIAAVAERLTAHLHGACVGSGIELPAFAHRVVARPGTRIWLPELSLGLIPGAGGTVSLARRIGRQRTTRLALTGEVLDAATALEWGLVDEVTDQ